MTRYITCTYAGRYPLTRGKRYALIVEDGEGGVVVRDDKGRKRYVPASFFDMSGGDVPLLTAWRFDEPVVDEENGRTETDNGVDISLRFSDGTRRWCQMMTPDFLKGLLEGAGADPAFTSASVIFVRDLAEETVERALYELDRKNELIACSQSYDAEG